MTLRKHVPLLVALVIMAIAVASARAESNAHPKIDPDQGWQTLFDGTDLSRWAIRSQDDAEAPADAWVVEDGLIVRKGNAYLRTVEKYGDFVFDIQFKVGPKANSGVLIRHNPEYAEGKKYWFNGLLEIQLFDSFGRPEMGSHDCGALYDMVIPSANPSKKPGEWNRMTITAKGSDISVVLNGQEIVDADLSQWSEPGKNPDGTSNKYAKPMCLLTKPGYIWLQHHPGEIWFREIYVKPLD